MSSAAYQLSGRSFHMPPAALVAWTEYVALLAATIVAVRALWHGGSAARHKARQMRGT